jgi:hypothetical protein
MKTATVLLGVWLQAVALSGANRSAHAFDLVGAWTFDTSVCPKLFTKTAKAISFKRDSADYQMHHQIEEGKRAGNDADGELRIGHHDRPNTTQF